MNRTMSKAFVIDQAVTLPMRKNKESQTVERYSHNSHIDGERMQNLIKREAKPRNSGEEPEIKSAFSTEKSSDYAVNPRKYKKSKYDTAENEKERNTLTFGYGQPVEITKRMPKDSSKSNKKARTQQDIGVKDLKIKFDFANDNEDDSDSADDENEEELYLKEIDHKSEFGRQTIDLNGPIYDQNEPSQRGDECYSEAGHPQSEVDDVNKLLEQMDNTSFKGFRDSDLGNSIDEKLNEGNIHLIRIVQILYKNYFFCFS